MNREVDLPDLQPGTWIDELGRLSTDEIESRYPGVLLLVVELRDDTPELEQGLDENRRWEGQPPKRADVHATTTATFPALRAAGARPSLEGMDRIQLLAKLSGARHFILPLFKRKSASEFEETKLTVGRNEGTDVMLHHSSVSKLHAWFEQDQSGALYLSDAGSLNGTRVNGKPLRNGELQWIQPLDQLQFGNIAAFTCSVPVLRSVLRSLSAAKRALGELETP